MKINSDFKDLLQSFVDGGIRFLVAGGYAVIRYTEPYYTKDLDLWVEPELDNLRKALAALIAFGAPVGEVRAEDLLDPDVIYQVGVAPVRVDLMSNIPGLSFDASWQRRETGDFDGLPVPVLSLDDLLAAKKTANRPKDRIQVRQLEQARKKRGPRG